jgi:hypothetical protein
MTNTWFPTIAPRWSVSAPSEPTIAWMTGYLLWCRYVVYFHLETGNMSSISILQNKHELDRISLHTWNTTCWLCGNHAVPCPSINHKCSQKSFTKNGYFCVIRKKEKKFNARKDSSWDIYFIFFAHDIKKSIARETLYVQIESPYICTHEIFVLIFFNILN